MRTPRATSEPLSRARGLRLTLQRPAPTKVKRYICSGETSFPRCKISLLPFNRTWSEREIGTSAHSIVQNMHIPLFWDDFLQTCGSSCGHRLSEPRFDSFFLPQWQNYSQSQGLSWILGTILKPGKLKISEAKNDSDDVLDTKTWPCPSITATQPAKRGGRASVCVLYPLWSPSWVPSSSFTWCVLQKSDKGDVGGATVRTW